MEDTVRLHVCQKKQIGLGALFPNGLDQSPEILPCPDHGDGIQGIGLLFGPGDHLVDVLVPDHIELVGQTHFLVCLLDPADKGIGLLCLIAACDAADIGQLRQPFMGGGSELLHHMGVEVFEMMEKAQRT